MTSESFLQRGHVLANGLVKLVDGCLGCRGLRVRREIVNLGGEWNHLSRFTLLAESRVRIWVMADLPFVEITQGIAHGAGGR